MDTIRLENESGKIFRLSDYGMLLISFDAPEPEPKTYREKIDGADGDLDMTEWAGVIRYNTRHVSARIRDMTGYWARELIQFCHGRKIKITHSNDEDYFYYGRCSVKSETREHVTELQLDSVCEPYKLAQRETIITRAVTSSASILLTAQRKPSAPQITLSAPFTIQFDNATAALSAGTYTIPNMLITDTPKTMVATGSGTISIKWRDGVL